METNLFFIDIKMIGIIDKIYFEQYQDTFGVIIIQLRNIPCKILVLRKKQNVE